MFGERKIKSLFSGFMAALLVFGNAVNLITPKNEVMAEDGMYILTYEIKFPIDAKKITGYKKGDKKVMMFILTMKRWMLQRK